ncbi:MAG: hypothetical protein LRZ97_00200, partial [Candidatus Pacebacteria bacterium]|nr:hypothetical protein [Candidatus Paceibacterota bacterium]
MILFLGDAAIFFFALFCALSIRLGELVSLSFYKQHIIPFSILFVVYTLIMYMFGVYSKEFKYTTRNIFNTLLYATLWLMSFAVILFYLFQFDGVTPKTNLVLFGIVLFVLSLIWHTQVRQVAKSVRSKVIIIGGPECPLDFDVVRIVPLDMDNKLILNVIASSNVNKVLINFNHPKVLELLPSLYTLMLSGVSFINLDQIEEDDMGKVNLKTIDKRWILHSLQDKHIRLYRLAKRVIDIVVVLLLVPVCIIICPLVIA